MMKWPQFGFFPFGAVQLERREDFFRTHGGRGRRPQTPQQLCNVCVIECIERLERLRLRRLFRIRLDIDTVVRQPSTLVRQRVQGLGATRIARRCRQEVVGRRNKIARRLKQYNNFCCCCKMSLPLLKSYRGGDF